MKFLLLPATFFLFISVSAQTDSTALDKLRTESGVDPTRVATRASYSILIFDQQGQAAQLNNRLGLTIGVNKWSLAIRTDVVSRMSGVPGEGFKTGMGDVRFSILNAFFKKGRHALAGSVEFAIPTGKPMFGLQYFSATPSLTYSYTLESSLVLAIQPQYAFDIFKDPVMPELSILTIRSFIAKFTNTGYFFVFEPRPVFNLANGRDDLILSPIMGKNLGGGFNLIFLMEYPISKFTRDNRGTLYQFGFNKNF